MCFNRFPVFSTNEHVKIEPHNESWFKWRVTVSGELMFLESYGNCDVTNIVTLLLNVTKQFFITISDKHRNSPAVNI